MVVTDRNDELYEPQVIKRRVVSLPQQTKQEPAKHVVSQSSTTVLDAKAEMRVEEAIAERRYIQQQDVQREMVFEESKRFMYGDIVVLILKTLLGFLLLYFGVTNAGSFYTSSTRMSGALAEFFYVMQAGTICIVLGMLFLYSVVSSVKTKKIIGDVAGIVKWVRGLKITRQK